MTGPWYKLDRDGYPVACANEDEWARWMIATFPRTRRLQAHRVGSAAVSTLFTGISVTRGRPTPFETALFTPGGVRIWCWHSLWEAWVGHAATVAELMGVRAVGDRPQLTPWSDIEPADAVNIDTGRRPDILLPRNEVGELCPWPWEPQQLVGVPMGQYHCSYCLGMQVAGIPHLDIPLGWEASME